jgi:uncharacterized membrane protein
MPVSVSDPDKRRNGITNARRNPMLAAFIGTVLLMVVIVIVLAVIGVFSTFSRPRRGV